MLAALLWRSHKAKDGECMTTTEQRKSDQIGTMKVQPTPTLPMRRMRDAFTQDDTKVLGRILGQTTSAQIYLSI